MALTKITGQVINDTTGLVVGVTTVGGGVSAVDGFFSGILTATGDASFSGNVSVAGTLTYEDVTNIDAVGLVTARNGIVVGSGITLSKDGDIFATGVTTSTTFVGALTGNVTGNVTGNSDTATNSTNASHVLVTDNESTNENNLITFVEDATSSTGNVGLEMDGNLTYNPSTGTVSATAFSGDGSALTGIGGTDFIHAEQVNVSGIVTATAFIPTTGQLSHRNLLINGEMKINQRVQTGTLGYFNPVTSSIYTLDRWKVMNANSFDTDSAQVTQDSSGPDGFRNSIMMNIGNTETPSSNQVCGFQQKIEAQDLQHLKFGTSSAETTTLSFWVYSNKTGTYCIQVIHSDVSKYVLYEYTINSSNTWEKKTITISGNTSNTITDDNGVGLNVIWVLCAGSGRHVSATSSWTSSGNALATSNQVNLWDNADNYFKMTGCQLEVGSVATPFEHRKTGDELTLCQRYFQRLGYGRTSTYVAIGILVNSTQARCTINLGVSMRDNPTASEVGTLKADTEMSSSTNVTSVVSDYTTVNGGRVNFNIDSHSQGQGQVIQILTNGTTSGLDFDAEL